MDTILELLKPYLEQALPDGAEYTALDHANLVVTLPKLDHMSYRKSIRLIFENHVIEAVTVAHASANFSVEERVGNYLCNVLNSRFSQWGTNNVQMTFNVDSHALDV